MLPNVLFSLLNTLPIRLLKQATAEGDVVDEGVAAGLSEVFSHDNAQHLDVRVGRHSVGGDDPATRAQVVGQGELVVVAILITTLLGGAEAEGHEWQASTRALRHDDKALLLKGVGKIISGSGQVAHDGTVTMLAETDELVVLADDLGGALREVQGERGLVGTKVVDVKDQLLGKVLGVSPESPTDTRVDKTVLEFGVSQLCSKANL